MRFGGSTSFSVSQAHQPLRCAIPDSPRWKRWASMFVFEQPGERTLARFRCRLKVTSHVQTSSFIQAENWRQHLQPRVKSQPHVLPPHIAPSPLTPSMGGMGKTQSRRTRHMPLPLLPQEGCSYCSHFSRYVEFCSFCCRKGKVQLSCGRDAIVPPGTRPDHETPAPGSPRCLGSWAGSGLPLPGSTEKHHVSHCCRSHDWL